MKQIVKVNLTFLLKFVSVVNLFGLFFIGCDSPEEKEIKLLISVIQSWETSYHDQRDALKAISKYEAAAVPVLIKKL